MMLVSVTSIVDHRMIFQFVASERKISPTDCGFCALNTFDSCTERRIQNSTGMIEQPNRNGMRHPHASICSGDSVKRSTTPRTAAISTENCWLADCHDT